MMVTIGACIAAVFGAVLCCSVLHAWEARKWRSDRAAGDNLNGRLWREWERRGERLANVRQGAVDALKDTERLLSVLNTARLHLQTAIQAERQAGRYQEGGDLSSAFVAVERAWGDTICVQQALKRTLVIADPREEVD